MPAPARASEAGRVSIIGDDPPVLLEEGQVDRSRQEDRGSRDRDNGFVSPAKGTDPDPRGEVFVPGHPGLHPDRERHLEQAPLGLHRPQPEARSGDGGDVTGEVRAVRSDSGRPRRGRPGPSGGGRPRRRRSPGLNRPGRRPDLSQSLQHDVDLGAPSAQPALGPFGQLPVAPGDGGHVSLWSSPAIDARASFLCSAPLAFIASSGLTIGRLPPRGAGGLFSLAPAGGHSGSSGTLSRGQCSSYGGPQAFFSPRSSLVNADDEEVPGPGRRDVHQPVLLGLFVFFSSAALTSTPRAGRPSSWRSRTAG